ncbi:Secretion protein HlyD [Candidatus Sulfotelmatobacter kueseliae]|uniref:Secretion protein HlyD n=1 Tax=Candidatus Sulfotelmatobacter kueseliae TaxID=2042962 RepID=A0A2U3JV62_9BACT|nr:Secretion protein HlyD [Candidatus Sulfotelmatobacter kueseliae]
MKPWKKIAIGAGVVVLLAIIVGFTVHQSSKNVVTVQTGKVQRQDLATVVSASGEIKPKTYVNIGANAYGKITHLYVKEGDQVKRGQLLAQIDNVQSAADVSANQASVQAAETDAIAADAALKTSQADLLRAQADYDRNKLDWERAQNLFQGGLISKSDFDSRQNAWATADSGLVQAQARVAQAKAQNDSAYKHLAQARANLTRVNDVLQKATYAAPYDGVVTNLPVREGESVVVGIQNALGSTLMTIADMSVITAEVKVDETDIVNVHLGQPAEVTIDAIPGKTFHGKVSEIGDNAIVRSSGVSTSQQATTSEEAKDFKVVVTLTDPPKDLRPGLSTTAKITTATRSNALSVPIQALTLRTKEQVEQQNNPPGSVHAAAPAAKEVASKPKKDDETQGVFVIRNKKAMFVPVTTGITGTTDIEVLDGLKEGDEVITGSYKVLRSLRPGSSVKIDNSVPKKEEEESS